MRIHRGARVKSGAGLAVRLSGCRLSGCNWWRSRVGTVGGSTGFDRQPVTPAAEPTSDWARLGRSGRSSCCSPLGNGAGAWSAPARRGYRLTKSQVRCSIATQSQPNRNPIAAQSPRAPSGAQSTCALPCSVLTSVPRGIPRSGVGFRDGFPSTLPDLGFLARSPRSDPREDGVAKLPNFRDRLRNRFRP